MPPPKSDRGSAPIELALGVAVILLPSALMVLSFGPWLESRAFVRSAAAVAARHVVVSGSEDGLSEAISAMATNAGVPPSSVGLSLCGGLPSPLESGLSSSCLPLSRDGSVTVMVVATVPLVVGPWGGVGGVSVSATHTEFVDLYRAMP